MFFDRSTKTHRSCLLQGPSLCPFGSEAGKVIIPVLQVGKLRIMKIRKHIFAHSDSRGILELVLPE